MSEGSWIFSMNPKGHAGVTARGNCAGLAHKIYLERTAWRCQESPTGAHSSIEKDGQFVCIYCGQTRHASSIDSWPDRKRIMGEQNDCG